MVSEMMIHAYSRKPRHDEMYSLNPSDYEPDVGGFPMANGTVFSECRWCCEGPGVNTYLNGIPVHQSCYEDIKRKDVSRKRMLVR